MTEQTSAAGSAVLEAEARQASTPAPGAATTSADVPPPGFRREVLVVLPGIVITLLLAVLDNLVVGTAMPKIVGELGGFEHLSWVVTSYVLATTISTPIYGKLGDLYGRKRIMIAAVVIFLVGSALSGAAQSMAQLITFRAVQGIGAGGLMVSALAVIADLIPARERGRYQGIMMAFMSLGMVAGPLVGGLITDHWSWRWIFYVNLPLGGLALILLVTTLHLPKRRTEHRIDYLGAALLGACTAALVLITTWGGSEYAWRSPQIIGLAVVGVLTLVAFLYVETRVAEPILPLRLFKNRNFSLVTTVGFLVGFAMFGALTFLPLYQQTVQGASATNSGLLILPMMAGMVVTSLISGALITRTGRYRWFPIIGGAGMASGMFLLSLLDVGTTRMTSSWYMLLLGIGMGFLMQTIMLIIQNSVEPRDIGVASASMMFFRQIGGAFGVSIFGAIFNRQLRDSLSGVQVDLSTERLDPEKIKQLAAPVQDELIAGIAHAVQSVFGWAVLFAVLAFALAWFIKEVPLRGRAAPPPAD